MSAFGSWVRMTREEYERKRGEPFTQQRLAELLGVSVAAVSRWESGSRVPGRITRDAVGRVLAEQMAGAGAHCPGSGDGLGGKSSTVGGV